MRNVKRYFEEGIPYFVTTVTYERRPLFQNPKLCRILLITIEYHKTIFDYLVYGYCIMPDHLHIILKPTGEFTLSYIMKMIKGSFARKINRLKGKKGSLWQAGYYDEGIRSNRQLLIQINYMHQNPVVSGLVKSAREYPYSSFLQYHKLAAPESQILQIDKEW